MLKPLGHPIAAELRVVVHPAPSRCATVCARRMDREEAPWIGLEAASEGIWTKACLEPGLYLVRFADGGCLTEHRPVDLQLPGAQLDLFAVARGARRVRMGSRRVPTNLGAEEVDVFLVEGADGPAALAVLDLARREGLRVQADRVVDPGIEALVARVLESSVRDEPPCDEPAVGSPGAAEGPSDVGALGHGIGKLLSLAIGRLNVSIDARVKASIGGPITADLGGRLKVPAAEAHLGNGERDPGRRAIERFAATLKARDLTRRISAVIPLVATTPAEASRAVSALRRSPHVAAAGARLSSDPTCPAVRRPSILLRLLAGADPRVVIDAVSRAAAEPKRPAARLLPAGPSRRPSIADRYVLDLPPDADEVIEDILDAVLATGAVRWATPDLACRPDLHSQDSGADVLSELQWEHEVLKIEAAHDLLDQSGVSRGGIDLALLDNGVPHVKGWIDHLDLRGRIALYDGGGHRDTRGEAHDGFHGGMVATVAAATDHPGKGPGMKGVAPDARLKAFKLDGPVERLWSALLVAGYTGGEYVAPADVIIVAMQYSPSAESPRIESPELTPVLMDADVDALELVSHRGRHGRGCLVLFSAGNKPGDLATINPVAASPYALTCGASTVDGSRKEGPAKNCTSGDGLDCVAPGYRLSSSGARAATYALETEPRRNWPSHTLVDGTIDQASSSSDVGDSFTLVVRMDTPQPEMNISEARVPIGGRLLIRAHDGGGRSLWEISAVTSSTRGLELTVGRVKSADGEPKLVPEVGMRVGLCDIRLASILEYAAEGSPSDYCIVDQDIPEAFKWVTVVDRDSPSLQRRAPIHSVTTWPNIVKVGFKPGTLELTDHTKKRDLWWSASGYRDFFGETSSAVALCGGVAALVLAANPRLTAVEARHIIRDSCDSLNFEKKYQGSGRVNALEAVKRALAYDHPRDLCLYTPPPDQGNAARGTGIGAIVPDSPDIWATNGPCTAEELEESATVIPDDEQQSTQVDPTHICVRVRNKGPTLPSYEASLRLYIAPTQRDKPSIWPTHWTPESTGDAKALKAGIYLIGEVDLLEGIPAGGARVVQIELPEWAKPNGESLWARDVLVEITPHDGRIPAHEAGFKTSTILTNDNLARRSLTFSEP